MIGHPTCCCRAGGPQEERARSSYTSQYNTTGWPAGVVRAGTSKDDPGLPLGIQLVAQPWRDDVVLAAMAHVEKRTGGWQPPALVSKERPS
jgi:amidase